MEQAMSMLTPPGIDSIDVDMISAGQSRAARGLLAWTQERLAARAGVSLSTVRDFEAERRKPIGATLAAMQRALEEAGIVFTNGGEPGVKLKAR